MLKYSRRVGGDLFPKEFPSRRGEGRGGTPSIPPIVMIRELGSAFLQGQVQRSRRLPSGGEFRARSLLGNVRTVPLVDMLPAPPLRSSVDGLDQKNGYRESDVETIRRS